VLRWSTWSALLLGVILVRRYDAVVPLALCLVVFGCHARRPLLVGLGAGLGIAAKGLPIVVAPLPILYWASRRRWREMAIAIGMALLVGLALGLPAVLLAGRRVLDMFAYHAGRPLQVESTGGAILILARALVPDTAHLSQTFGSANVVAHWDGPLRLLSGLSPILAIAATSAWAYRALARAPREDKAIRVLARAICIALIGWMVLGKVFSPQYLTWILPLGVLAATEKDLPRATPWLLAVALGLTQIIYPFLYRVGLANALHPIFGAVVLARTGLLFAFAVLLWRGAASTGAQARSGPTKPPAS
jgi:hypothetical protein